MKLLNLLNEVFDTITHYPFTKKNDTGDNIRYKFSAKDDLPMSVTIWHNAREHGFGMYEVSFAYENQKSPSELTNKGTKNFAMILSTVMKIVEIEVKDKKIKEIKIDGAMGQGDSGFFGSTTKRSRIYLNYILDRYPQEAVTAGGPMIRIDMTKAFPEIFENEEEGLVDKFMDLLVSISDANPDREELSRGLDGIEPDNFSLSTDFIENSKLGGILIELMISEPMGEYSLEWELFDSNEEGSEFFNSAQEAYDFINNKFNS